MQYTNIYIMVNMQTCISCLNGVKKYLSTIFFTTCKFVMACHDNNVISNSTIYEKKIKGKKKDDMVCYSMSY
jgi:hypothetical protein